MPEQGETRLIHCPECGLHTRHEWQEWEKWSFLTRLIGLDHPILMGGWVCTSCGHRTSVRRIEGEQEADQ
jgi:DNA-directed RNA polymerase subunit RPC12/RpoP